MKSFGKQKYKNLTTTELVVASQEDDFDALEELIRREQKNIYASFYYLDPNRQNLLDLTQEALFRMSRNIKSLRNPKLFKSWLGQIISNLFCDELRKKQKSPNLISIDSHWNEHSSETSAEILGIKDNHAKPDESCISKEVNDVIREQISKLPDIFRFAIVLREIQGLSYDEIAKITNTSVGTVKSRISRARNKLQEELKPYLT